MTVETIDRVAYEARIDSLAADLAEIVRSEEPIDDTEQSDILYEAVDDLLYGEDWFTRSYYGPAAHGCIVEHQLHDMLVDPGVTEADSPEESIKRLAYEVVRGDVLEEARLRLVD